MKEQLDIFEIENVDFPEEEVYQKLLPIFFQVLDANNIDRNLLSMQSKKGFSSIMLSSYLVARLCFRGGNHYVSVPTLCSSAIPNEAKVNTETKETGFVRVSTSPPSVIVEYHKFFCKVLEYAIDRIPKEFDCCSRYVECSNAIRCTNPNQELALGCGYKRVLKSGKVFYGPNRTVY